MDSINRGSTTKYVFEDIHQEMPAIQEGAKLYTDPKKFIPLLISKKENSIKDGKTEVTVIFSRQNIPVEKFKNLESIEDFNEKKEAGIQHLKDFIYKLAVENPRGNLPAEKRTEMFLKCITKVYFYNEKFTNEDKNKFNKIMDKISKINDSIPEINAHLLNLEEKLKSLNEKNEKVEPKEVDRSAENKLKKLIKNERDSIKNLDEKATNLENKKNAINKKYARPVEYPSADDFIENVMCKGFMPLHDPAETLPDSKATKGDDAVAGAETAINSDRKASDSSPHSPSKMQEDTISSPQGTPMFASPGRLPKPPKPLPKPPGTPSPQPQPTPKQNVVSDDTKSSDYSSASSLEANNRARSSPTSAHPIAGSHRPVPSTTKKL